MILTCPECSARYIVDPKVLLPNGRVVRCAKCKHSWKEDAPDKDTPVVDKAEATGPQTPPAAKSDNEATGPDEPDTTEDEFAIRRTQRRKRPRPLPKGTNLPALQNHKYGHVLWGWYGLGAFLVLFVTSFLIFQTTISEIWPPSHKLYRSLGLENGYSWQKEPDGKTQPPDISFDELFKIENTIPSKVLNGTVVTLKIEGDIANLADRTLDLPLLRISLKDDQGQTIREWTFKSSAATISRGEKIPFSTSLPNPPEDATSISVTFAKK
ncbi:MAG: hypothetical protein COB49_05595 [Alphaproteobacteria bacterium]|nr:MAG: hypothetical protein COB49_05595 [Alphaproteobacteria bacterium]